MTPGSHVARGASPGALRAGPQWPLAALASLICVAGAVALASGHLAGGGLRSLAAAIFVVLCCWSIAERRSGRSLVVLGLYLGLLDGYLKLRTGSRDLTFARDILLWAIAAGVLIRSASRGGSLRAPPLSGFVAAFALIVLAELANPSSPGLVQGLAGLRQHLEFVPLFFLGYALVRSREALRTLLAVLVVVAAANGIVSYVQSTRSPEQLAAWGSGYRDRILGTGLFVGQHKVASDQVGGQTVQHVRPFGLGSELGAGGIAAALGLPALIVLLLLRRGRWRWLALACLLPVALAVATAGSRAAVIACFASVGAFAALASVAREAVRVTLAVLVGLVVLLGVLSQLSLDNSAARRAQSVAPTRVLQTFRSERADSVLRVGSYLVRYPLGVGIGTVGPASQVVTGRPSPYDAETEWNLAVLETGVAGLLVLLALGLRLIVLALTRIRLLGDSELRLMLSAVAAPLIGLFVVGFAGPITVTAPASPYLWLASGVLGYWLIERRRGLPDGDVAA